MDEEAKEIFTLDGTSECDNCGYRSIIKKIPTAICPNYNKHKLLMQGEK